MNSNFPRSWTTCSLGYFTKAQLGLISDIIGNQDRPVREFWRSLNRDPSCEYEHVDIISYAQIVVNEIPEFLLANLAETEKIVAKDRPKVAQTYYRFVQSVIILTFQLEKLIRAVTEELDKLNKALRQAEKQGPDTGIVPDEDSEGEDWKNR